VSERNNEAAGAGSQTASASPVSFAFDAIDWVSRWVIILMLAAMTTTVAVQVFFRYALNDSLDWADEVSRLTFVWVVFLALPHGLKVGAHVGIDLVVRLISAPAQVWLFRFTSAVAAALMLVVATQGVITSYRTWDQPLATINAPAALFYIALIIGATHSALYLLRFASGYLPSGGPGSEGFLEPDEPAEPGHGDAPGEKQP
jgi:TRAP-type transport system small permease protein